MGKKRVAQKTENVGVNEKVKAGASRSKSNKKVDSGFVYINATYNNTMITATDMNGNVVAWSTSGSLGFSGPKKATPFAASKVVASIIEKIKRNGPFNIHIVVRGIGGGRDSSVRTFGTNGFNILSIRDATPIPHNGPRQKKRRRV